MSARLADLVIKTLLQRTHSLSLSLFPRFIAMSTKVAEPTTSKEEETCKPEQEVYDNIYAFFLYYRHAADTTDQSKDSSSANGGDAAKSSAEKQQKTVDPEELIDMNTFDQLLDMDEEDDHEFSYSIVLNYFEQAEETFKDMDAALYVIQYIHIYMTPLLNFTRFFAGRTMIFQNCRDWDIS